MPLNGAEYFNYVKNRGYVMEILEIAAYAVGAVLVAAIILRFSGSNEEACDHPEFK